MDFPHTLAVHRFLLRASLALGNVFAWILIFHALYVSGETIVGALFLASAAFAFLQLLIFFLTPLAAANIKHGTVRSMILAAISQSAALLWLAASSVGVFGMNQNNILWGIVGFVLLTALYRAFYWVPYSAIGIYTKGHWSQRTRFLLELFLALLPVTGALLITSGDGGTWLMLVMAAVSAFFASLSLLHIPDTYERFEWGYAATVHALFSRENRTSFSNSLLEGMQGAGLLFVWPLTIFLLFNWSYLKLGILLSITFLLVLLFRKSTQKIIRRFSFHESPRFLAVVAGGAWILRLVAISPVTVVLADTLHHIGIPARRLGMDPISMEQAADSSHYIDEYTALKEMGNSLGRGLVCAILAVALFFAEPIVALALALIFVGAATIAHLYLSSSSEIL